MLPHILQLTPYIFGILLLFAVLYLLNRKRNVNEVIQQAPRLFYIVDGCFQFQHHVNSTCMNWKQKIIVQAESRGQVEIILGYTFGQNSNAKKLLNLPSMWSVASAEGRTHKHYPCVILLYDYKILSAHIEEPQISQEKFEIVNRLNLREPDLSNFKDTQFPVFK